MTRKLSDAFSTLWNGVEMPRVGFGTWQLKGNDCYQSVLNALQNGYKLIDTASVYGNEEQVKEALKEYKKHMVVSPSSKQFKTGNEYGIFVTSKANTSEIGANITYQACKNSLKRLGLERLDLYLLHWPGCQDIPSDDPNNRRRRREAWMDMEKLYKEGKCRAIGVSNYLVNHLEDLIKDGITIKPMVDQLEYHPLCQNENLLEWSAVNIVQLQAYSSLGIGNTKLLEHPVILKISEETKKTAAQVLLRWGLQKNLCVIPRSKTKSRIVENFDILNFSLSEKDMEMISNIQDKARFCWDPTKVV